MSDLLVKPEVSDPTTEDPDAAHLCRKEDVARAYVTGEAIEALCGKIWVPTRDPDNYLTCQACLETLERIKSSSSN